MELLLVFLALTVSIATVNGGPRDSRKPTLDCNGHQLKKTKVIVDSNNNTINITEAVTAYLCRKGRSSDTIAFPSFVMDSLDGDLKFDTYWNRWKRNLKIKLVSMNDWKQEIVSAGIVRSSYDLKIISPTSVQFANSEYKNFKNLINSNQVPCYDFAAETKTVLKEERVNNVTTKYFQLSLIDMKQNDICFLMLTPDMINEVVKVKFSFYLQRFRNKDYYEYNTPIQITNSVMSRLPSGMEITIQQRVDGSLSFARSWREYERGFGETNKNYWMGLDKIHRLTNNMNNKLKVRFEMKDNSDSDIMRFAVYNTFRVGSVDDNYRLTIGEFNENLSNFNAETIGENNGMLYHNDMPFSSFDKDLDKNNGASCSRKYSYSGWWMKSCHTVNGNALWTNQKSGEPQYIRFYSANGGFSMRYFRIVVIG